MHADSPRSRATAVAAECHAYRRCAEALDLAYAWAEHGNSRGGARRVWLSTAGHGQWRQTGTGRAVSSGTAHTTGAVASLLSLGGLGYGCGLVSPQEFRGRCLDLQVQTAPDLGRDVL